MPNALGISGTYQAIRSSNGPAQHIAISLVGLTYCGMFVGMVPDIVLLAWAASSVLVLLATVWLKKIWLKRSLLLDFTLSFAVLTFYLLHDHSAPTGPVYHVMAVDGMRAGSRGQDPMNMLDMFSHSLACVMMATWSLYLANLVQRQLLEAQRFEVTFNGEVLK
jgi:lysylphosphatidylglycerol synthetase-like protein (DUF2156 family)